MSKYLREAIYVLNSTIIFVFVLAISGITVFSGGLSTEISLINMMASLILTPIIFGRLTGIIRAEQQFSLFNVFKRYWLIFYKVTLLLSAPALILLFISPGTSAWRILFFGITGLISILSLYVTPLIFLDGQSISVIPDGIEYLLGNLRWSMPLILLYLVMHAINHAFNYAASFYSQDALFRILIMGFLKELLCNYLNLLIFITASMVLVNDSSKNLT